MDRATWMQDWAPERGKKDRSLPRILQGLGKAATNIIDAGFDAPVNMTSAALSFFDPPTTPAQREQAAENSRAEREDQGQRQIDFSRWTADIAQERQNHQEQQAARDRQRETERER
jgi:hypothetical protein